MKPMHESIERRGMPKAVITKMKVQFGATHCCIDVDMLCSLTHVKINSLCVLYRC